MTDDLESDLRASLQTLTVRHDDHRADEMIAVASGGRPLPGRRAMLAPLVTAAAVAALGVTVAVAARDGHAPAPAGPPAGAASPSDPDGSIAYAIALVVPATGDRFVAQSKFPGVSDEPGTDLTHRIRVTNPRGDEATVRVTNAEGVVVYDEDLAGRTSSTTYLAEGTTASNLSASVQCRRPGHGDRCQLTLTVGNIDLADLSPAPTEAPPSTGSPVPATTPVPSTGSPGATTPAASCAGCEVP